MTETTVPETLVSAVETDLRSAKTALEVAKELGTSASEIVRRAEANDAIRAAAFGRTVAEQKEIA